MLLTLTLNCTTLLSQQQTSRPIRIWGAGVGRQGTRDPLITAWEDGFRKRHPTIHFETQLYGNASAIGGVYTGAADIAFLTREIEPTEVEGYQQALGRKPLQISVLTGSLDRGHYDPAIAIFVHKDNPLAKLTLTELDAIFGADHRRGLKNLRTWGELGLTGEWAEQPINLYGYDISSDVSQFFELSIMAGSEKWNCSLREFRDLRQPTATIEAGQQILDTLANDRYGIAISSLSYQNPSTKPLALAREEGGTAYPATKETVRDRTYPLARSVSIFIDRMPDQPMAVELKDFVGYILSPEGQAVAARAGGFIPLTPELALQERRKIE